MKRPIFHSRFPSCCLHMGGLNEKNETKVVSWDNPLTGPTLAENRLPPFRRAGMRCSIGQTSDSSRRSTSSTYLVLGSRPVFKANSNLAILNLSCGEAGTQEPATDSSACKGPCSRRSAGKVRHVHCAVLHCNTRSRGVSWKSRIKQAKDLPPDVGTPLVLRAGGRANAARQLQFRSRRLHQF